MFNGQTMPETITLNYPIEVNGIETSTLTLRRPSVGDLLNSTVGKSTQEGEVYLLANLCGVAPDDIKRMDLSDYFQLQDKLGKMQGRSLTSSA